MKKLGKTTGHAWRFFRAGGFDQVRLDTGNDLLSLGELDQKLWVALACPVDMVHFDVRTLSLIDTDGDRRIRAGELIAAIRWTASLLRNPDDLVTSSDSLSLKQINDSGEPGKKIASAVRSALVALGRTEDDSLSVSDAQQIGVTLANRPLNGDGIITTAAAPDERTRTVISEIVTTIGSVPDRSGEEGIDAARVDEFFAQTRALYEWMREPERDPSILPLTDATNAAGEALSAVREKIDDYFTRCTLAEFDPRASEVLNGSEKEYESIARQPLRPDSGEIASLPLARILARQPLPLGEGINPAWTEAMDRFYSQVVLPLLGERNSLSTEDWRRVCTALGPWKTWSERKPKTSSKGCDVSELRALLECQVHAGLKELIDRDKAEAVTFEAMADLEKLLRFRRDLYSLCTNFVNFKDFYSRGHKAMFQAGTLYLDQRSCTLCIRVSDPVAHSQMAAMAGTCLVYCECRRRNGTDRMNLAVAVTNGDSENLMIGRNGVFYDRAGNDWDATVVRIIENPISIRQAFWLPYKGFVRMIETQVARRAAEAEVQSTAKLQDVAVTAANADQTKPAPVPKKLDIGIVAALGVAAGALGTFFATLLGYVAGIVRLGPFAVIGAVLGLLALISGPSIVLAYIKLRKRNLGPILDASGWAINAKARINIPFGAVLTGVAALPPGSQRDLVDPYAEKKSPWPRLAAAVFALYLAWFALDRLGFIGEWTGGRFGMKSQISRPAASDQGRIRPAGQ